MSKYTGIGGETAARRGPKGARGWKHGNMHTFRLNDHKFEGHLVCDLRRVAGSLNNENRAPSKVEGECEGLIGPRFYLWMLLDTLKYGEGLFIADVHGQLPDPATYGCLLECAWFISVIFRSRKCLAGDSFGVGVTRVRGMLILPHPSIKSTT